MGFTKKTVPNKDVLALQEQLEIVREELRQAYHVFDQVVDDDLIEASIYRMNAALAQCNYLVRTIKAYTSPPPAVAAVAQEEGVKL